MMKKNTLSFKIVLLVSVFIFGSFLCAQASLTTIGTATYQNQNYNLIWDDDNNGNSIVWLDYSKDLDTWENQRAWAAGLTNVLTYNIDDGFSLTWEGSWRLPNTFEEADTVSVGFDGTTTLGSNITSSEFGHLFYEELGELAYYDTSGNVQDGWSTALANKGDFDNIVTRWWNFNYWSGTEQSNADEPIYAYSYEFLYGQQGKNPKNTEFNAMPVRNAQVSAVPVPGALWLLGSGLLGLAGIKRKTT